MATINFKITIEINDNTKSLPKNSHPKHTCQNFECTVKEHKNVFSNKKQKFVHKNHSSSKNHNFPSKNRKNNQKSVNHNKFKNEHK